MGQDGFSILILGAGKATRFKSEYPKLLHALAGRLMGEYVLRAATAAGAERVYMIIGHQAEEMRKAFARPGAGIHRAEGATGHRPRADGGAPGTRTVPQRSGGGAGGRRAPAPTGNAERAGGHPPQGTRGMHHPQHARGQSHRLRTDRARGGEARSRHCGRKRWRVRRRKRSAKSTPASSVFRASRCWRTWANFRRANAQKEYLLTDLVEIFNRHRLKVGAFEAPAEEAVGINDRAQLAEVGKMLRLRKAHSLMKEGVTLADPEATYIDEDVVDRRGHGHRARRCFARAHALGERLPGGTRRNYYRFHTC